MIVLEKQDLLMMFMLMMKPSMIVEWTELVVVVHKER